MKHLGGGSRPSRILFLYTVFMGSSLMNDLSSWVRRAQFRPAASSGSGCGLFSGSLTLAIRRMYGIDNRKSRVPNV
jgi:hypothetical protein